MASEEGLVQALVHLADRLVDDFDIIDLLTVLADQAVELGTADAAGILVVDDDGHLRLLAGSSEQARLLELIQLQNEEGPCPEACATGHPIIHGDLAAATERWPKFAPAAVSAGFRSVCALPLRLRQRNIGAFNLFRNSVGELDSVNIILGQALAEVAAVALLQDQTVRGTRTKVDQLEYALDSRIIIEQAKGMISEQAHVDMDEAFTRLRSYARSHQLRLTEVARQVTTGRLLPDELAHRTRQNAVVATWA